MLHSIVGAHFCQAITSYKLFPDMFNHNMLWLRSSRLVVYVCLFSRCIDAAIRDIREQWTEKTDRWPIHGVAAEEVWHARNTRRVRWRGSALD